MSDTAAQSSHAVSYSTSASAQEEHASKHRASGNGGHNASLRTTDHRISLLNSPDSDDDADETELTEAVDADGQKLAPEEADTQEGANDHDKSEEEKSEEWEENV